jgi:hypothetical protein
MASCNFLDI